MPSNQRRWAAKWIWSQDGRYTNAHVLFRRDFDVVGDVSRATCFIAVESFARVYLNGSEIFRSSSISYPGQQNYETIDLRPHLRSGRNELAVLAWYVGVGSTGSWLKDPGLLCEIEIGDQRIGTDDQWRCLTLKAWCGEARSYQFNLDLQEILDYRLLPDGFPYPDLSTFLPPTALPWPGVRMGVVEERDFPAVVSAGDAGVKLVSASLVQDHSDRQATPALAVQAEELLSAVDSNPIKIPPAGHAVALVYDLGGYYLGTPQITIDAPAGTVVDLSWSESLKAGHVDMFGRTFTTDRYTLRDGITTITPEEWKAGKFLQLTIRRFDRPVHLQSVRFKIERYPLNRRIAFNSSDDRLNRIVDISLRAVQMCMHDRIMDCPYRERRVWVGDVQRIGLINYYAFDDRQLIRHTLKQQARLQDPTGRVWVCIPLMEEMPAQSMEWVRAILEYQHYTDDRSLAEDLRDNIEWLHRWFLKCRDDRGLWFNPNPPVANWEDNTLTGLAMKHQFRTPLLASNLRYLMFLDDIARLVPAAADQAMTERRKLEPLIVDRFLDRPTGLLREFADPELEPIFAEYNAALAVNANLPDFDAAAHFDRTMAHPAVVAASPFGKLQTFEALAKLGRTDVIVRHIHAGWGPMLDAGSETAWEWFPPRVSSYCHGWSGIPIVALLRHVLKIDPRSPERRRVENVAGVAWMETAPA